VAITAAEVVITVVITTMQAMGMVGEEEGMLEGGVVGVAMGVLLVLRHLACMVSLVRCMLQQVGEGHPRVEVDMAVLHSSRGHGSECWDITCRS
jgi:hypothetical protein